ncbi:MAG TPA: hypothetical protein VJ124_07125 [Pyrinomonadaceae bacterium]|nr:hypothetical protein [Pyrinomonadaceae bacterium]
MIDPLKNTFHLALEIAIFVAVVVADAYGVVPITQTIFLLPLIWVMLRLRRERWSSIGFARPDRFGWTIDLLSRLPDEQIIPGIRWESGRLGCQFAVIQSSIRMGSYRARCGWLDSRGLERALAWNSVSGLQKESRCSYPRPWSFKHSGLSPDLFRAVSGTGLTRWDDTMPAQKRGSYLHDPEC